MAVVNRKNYFVARKILPEKRAEVFFQIFVQSAARRDDGNKRREIHRRRGKLTFEEIQVINPAAKRFPAQKNEHGGEKVEHKNHLNIKALSSIFRWQVSSGSNSVLNPEL